MFVFMSVVVIVWGSVVMFFCVAAIVENSVRNASPKGPMCFRCLILNLSGPCELLFWNVEVCCVCVRVVMDVVFSVCIVLRSACLAVW